MPGIPLSGSPYSVLRIHKAVTTQSGLSFPKFLLCSLDQTHLPPGLLPSSTMLEAGVKTVIMWGAITFQMLLETKQNSIGPMSASWEKVKFCILWTPSDCFLNRDRNEKTRFPGFLDSQVAHRLLLFLEFPLTLVRYLARLLVLFSFHLYHWFKAEIGKLFL